MKDESIRSSGNDFGAIGGRSPTLIAGFRIIENSFRAGLRCSQGLPENLFLIVMKTAIFWDLLRSLLWPGQLAVPTPPVPSKAAAIARIERFVDRLLPTRDIFQYTSRSELMNYFDRLLENNEPLWAIVLDQGADELERAIDDIAVVYAAGAGFAHECSPGELAELRAISAGK